MEHILESAKEIILHSLSDIGKSVIDNGFTLIIKILITLLVYFIGKKVIKMLLDMVERAFNRGKMEAGAKGFLLAFMRAIFYIILIWIILVQIFSVKDASLVAVLGSAGLSIGLALQGGLSNLAGGIIILLLRPFKVGDCIIYTTNEGTVISIDIFYTKMLTADNRLVVMPNGALSNSSIINISNEKERRLDITIAVSSSENIDRVKNILDGIIKQNDNIIKETANSIFVSSFDAGTVSLSVRVWVKTEDYTAAKSKLLESVKKEFEENQIKM
ncbi:mechanosensitive ion channel family protein [Anaerocolumna xylanovorans]|uniref:Small conductance mechanosensitive channel n=1 Tax=Anaerocolumna xylanovorans DSM 12503 TaxID=1121345 RepID=A0A1M7Y0H9_9FIRM|nr:mechanosensitive ion channel domain-containing protein [Anaerocolumna xylanovorans]SHO45132.1 small conductance mechanosensitive channel [Anaerocolumna xylanovorans DSM 12503]